MNRLITGKVAIVIVLAALSFFVIYKAVHIPITFDESSSFGLCEQPVWQIMMNQNWDGSPSNWPNNHILNTILMKYSSAMFGTQPWALRLPNILAFILFGLGMYLLARRYFSDSLWLLFVPVILMFGNPYLLDFYSLARGYGMGCAFMACSILGLLTYTSSHQMRWYYIATIFAGLALYAQFTFLLYWLAIQIILFGILVLEGLQGRRIWHELLATGIVALICVGILCFILRKVSAMTFLHQAVFLTLLS
jgi:4-amino-4-deoxy-L-arabinose transferase-like glycosyltransferase